MSSKWTAKDIADAKAVRQLCPIAERVSVADIGMAPCGLILGVDNTIFTWVTWGSPFPSLKPGEKAMIDDILAAERETPSWTPDRDCINCKHFGKYNWEEPCKNCLDGQVLSRWEPGEETT